ncbi:thioredoxin-like protein [Macrophomina phaseolina]|uniref:Thioredoxin-like protein n=1 Tax=Macrophomina phaseolina TaxID=35725 RepID=A0ABQ8GQJ6_9PEZI|nr:thioredoxin-like protein [Macrophomina phaseolina]
MALNPRFAGQKLASGVTTAHTLELYLDYVCPFSKKMFNTIYDHVLPTIKSKYESKLQIIFRQQIQPWHPSSTLVHEAGAAVLRLAPNKFYDFSKALFDKQADFFDVNVVNETRNNTYKRLAKVAGGVGVDEKEFYSLLEISDKPGPDGSLNSGNKVTDDVKVFVKTNRLVGIHVTPTVVFNGVVENSISSSFTKEQWEEWLEKNIV